MLIEAMDCETELCHSFIVKMAYKTIANRHKGPEIEYLEDSDHMDETPSPGELLTVMKEMMNMMARHKEETLAQKNYEDG